MRTKSFGDISKSKFWLSAELRPAGWGFHIGKTYGGTKTGLVVCFGVGLLIAHVR